MTILRWRLPALVVAALVLAGAGSARAQGVTTGAVTGVVTDSGGQPLESAQIQLRNPLTGFNVGTVTRAGGVYRLQGVEPNGSYEITARAIGYAPVTRRGLRITLGETRREDFRLGRQVTELEAINVTAVADPVINAGKTGTSTTISDSALRRLPTLNRNFQDFVQLVPQVSTTTGYLSGGGVNLRQNQIQIDGAQSGDVFGLGTTGQPGAQANAKPIPLDAVKEYQVLLSPFDVRQGSFGGLLINAVTKGGTNDFHGSVYGYARDQALTRTQPYLNDFRQRNYGGTLGGPLAKDLAFFFVSAEIQQQRQPASGPNINSSDVYVSQASIDQLDQILSSRYGFTGAGTGAEVPRENPNTNIFARVDINLPFNTRAVIRNNYVEADATSFSRPQATASSPEFRLTSNKYQFSSKTNSTVGEFFTNFTNGSYNELLLNRSTTRDFRTVPVIYPQLTINGIPRTDNVTTASFVVGTERSSQGNALDQQTFELTDNFTVPVGTHSLTVGTKNVVYKSINLFAQNSRGNWTFASLASLDNGVASRYQVSAPAPTDPNEGLATIRARTYSLYAQDTWTVTPTFTLNYGVRWDKPDFPVAPPENDIVFTQYGRHTSDVPSLAQWSPRLGFNWDVTGDQRNQLRGGVGSFAGGVPFVYISNAFGNSGLSGFSSLTCTGAIPSATATTSLRVPAFNAANAATPPTSCAPYTRSNGTVVPGAAIAGPSSGAAVNTVDPDFKYPKYLKATLGFDHRIGQTLVATVEGLYTRAQTSAFYQNLALAGPTGVTDAHGRVLYGTFSATGGTPATTGARTQVLDLTNASGDYTWSVTGQLQQSFSHNFEGSVAYTYQQARDIVSITSSTAGSNFRYQRDVAGRLDDRTVSRSKYDQPHRIVATGSYRTPWAMDLSFIYTGTSGAPFDFVYGVGSGTGSGDANADGQSQNDLIYVPTDAMNPSEILFAGYNGNATAQATAAAQATAFEQFIQSNECLNAQRGRIVERNSCRNPWINEVDVSVAQSLGRFGGARFQNVQVRLDVINFGNLLNKNWGAQAFSDQGSTCGQICSATAVLTQSGNVLSGTAPAASAQGIYTFNTNYQAFDATNASSNYRMQLSLRYSF